MCRRPYCGFFIVTLSLFFFICHRHHFCTVAVAVSSYSFNAISCIVETHVSKWLCIVIDSFIVYYTDRDLSAENVIIRSLFATNLDESIEIFRWDTMTRWRRRRLIDHRSEFHCWNPCAKNSLTPLHYLLFTPNARAQPFIDCCCSFRLNAKFVPKTVSHHFTINFVQFSGFFLLEQSVWFFVPTNLLHEFMTTKKNELSPIYCHSHLWFPQIIHYAIKTVQTK